MRDRLSRSTAPGQSIPLIALLIVVLIAMVGLSVDVGNTYAQQRNTVRATNAAALAGMTELIRSNSDQKAGQIIQESLRSNQIEGVYADPNTLTQPDQRVIHAYYLDSKGNYLVSCNVGSCGTVPGGTTYIEVQVSGTVNTYFARVVQRPTLPVNAKAFAGRCMPTQGVYPIGIQVSNLDSNAKKFLDPTNLDEFHDTYYPPSYPGGLSRRRIYFKDNGDGPGQFSWLRWRAANTAGNATELAAMVQGDGNMTAGFDEGIFDASTDTFTWPDDNSQPPMVNGRVAYPVKPHEINTGDFVYGNTGVSMSTDVVASLKSHIDKQTVLILPIVNLSVKKGGDTVFPVQGLGAFYLTGIPGYGSGVNADTSSGGANGFFDLAYIGTANQVACLSTPAVVSNALGINGAVFVKPRWSLQQGQAPIAYEIIMDVSGSMSWNFDGQGSQGGNVKFEADTTGGTTTVQCESTIANPVNVPCNGGPSDPWKTVKERRIWVAKDALAGTGKFIDKMRLNDSMRIITFTSDGISKGPNWTGDKAALKDTVNKAGSYNNDKYLTKGGTPGPQALKAAGEVLASDPPPALPGGQKYKHVVIYMTDGVANFFLNGTLNTATDVCPQYGGDNRAINDAWCQVDKDGYDSNPNGARPISAMILEAGKIKTANPEMQLFVIAEATFNPLGLDFVATSPSYLYLASDPAKLYAALEAIYGAVVGPCAETGPAAWIGKMDSLHQADSPPMPSLPLGVYGYVYITNDAGAPVNIPWSGPGADPRGGVVNMVPIVTDLNNNLTFSVPPANGLPAGKYHATGYVNYKAANASPTIGGDGKSRQYSQLMQNLLPAPPIEFAVTPSDVLGSSVVVPPLYLDLNSNVTLCP